jgi:hypothetical protein
MNHLLGLIGWNPWRISCKTTAMMTRRDVLEQLKRVGIQELSQLKRDCREFEKYMATCYDYEILKRETGAKPPACSSPSSIHPRLKTGLKFRRYRGNYTGPTFAPPRIKIENNKGQ